MADAKLRLQIVTALDNAGIKATKDQIDGIEAALAKTKRTGEDSFGGIEKSLQKMPGHLGKIVSSLGAVGKAAGSAFAAFAVFKEAYDFGQKIREWAGETFAWAASFDQVQKKIYDTEQMIEAAHRDEVATVQFVANKKQEIAQKEDAQYEKAIQRIDNQTKAMLRQVNAVQAIKDAKGNTQLLQLERQKFDEAASYRMNGQDDAAEQVEKAYDIQIKMLKLKQQMEQYDLESAKLAKSKNQDEEKFLKLMDNVKIAEERMVAEREKLNKMTTRDEKYLEQKKVTERAERRFERLHNQSYDLGLKLTENAADDEKRAIERANLENAGDLELDRALQQLNISINKHNDKIKKLVEQQAEAEEDFNESLSDFEDSRAKTTRGFNKSFARLDNEYYANLDELTNKLDSESITQDEYDEQYNKLWQKYQNDRSDLYEQINDAQYSESKRWQQMQKSYYRQYDKFAENYDNASIRPDYTYLQQVINGLSGQNKNNTFDDSRLAEMLEQLLQMKGQ